VSSSWRWNHAAMILAASWTLALAASSTFTTGPYTIVSREALGSQLRKHVSTTFFARTRPSASSYSLMTLSSASILAPTESNMGSTLLTSRAGSPRANMAETEGC
jgi:hypothetical protein